MTATLATRLARLKNYSTRYELVAEGPAGKFLIVYTARKSIPGIVAGVRMRYADGSLVKIVPDAETARMYPGKRARDGVTLGNYRIYFSGRTQREAIIDGELTFLPEVNDAIEF